MAGATISGHQPGANLEPPWQWRRARREGRQAAQAEQSPVTEERAGDRQRQHSLLAASLAAALKTTAFFALVLNFSNGKNQFDVADQN